MSLILALETSSENCSVALFENTVVLGSKTNTERFKHSQVLFPMIQDLLAETGITMHDIGAIALSSGPGSFTGLRIGGAAALGMCHALEIPLIAINTLVSLISKMKKNYPGKALFCPMIDARRMEVYCMMQNSNNEVILPPQAKIIDANSFEEFDDKILCFGDGAEKCKHVLAHRKNIHFLDGVDVEASNMADIAYDRFCKNDFDDILTFEPNYLK